MKSFIFGLSIFFALFLFFPENCSAATEKTIYNVSSYASNCNLNTLNAVCWQSFIATTTDANRITGFTQRTSHYYFSSHSLTNEVCLATSTIWTSCLATTSKTFSAGAGTSNDIWRAKIATTTIQIGTTYYWLVRNVAKSPSGVSGIGLSLTYPSAYASGNSSAGTKFDNYGYIFAVETETPITETPPKSALPLKRGLPFPIFVFSLTTFLTGTMLLLWLHRQN